MTDDYFQENLRPRALPSQNVFGYYILVGYTISDQYSKPFNHFIFNGLKRAFEKHINESSYGTFRISTMLYQSSWGNMRPQSKRYVTHNYHVTN